MENQAYAAFLGTACSDVQNGQAQPLVVREINAPLPPDSNAGQPSFLFLCLAQEVATLSQQQQKGVVCALVPGDVWLWAVIGTYFPGALSTVTQFTYLHPLFSLCYLPLVPNFLSGLDATSYKVSTKDS